MSEIGFVEAARKLAPLIQSAADEIEATRELPPPVFEAIADAGLFHLALPRSLGCPEIDLPTYLRVIEEIGKADASTAWVVNQATIFATYAARMPREAARKIWLDPPRAIVANTPAASAQGIVVPGGYRVTGRQGFSTGCRHATWLAAHATIIENGAVRQAHGVPELRYCFVPVAQAEILDTWKVRGMRGTGTHHFAVNDVFVPAERSVLSATATVLEPGPLYKIPRTLLFAAGDATIALATARSALATFLELAGAKTPRTMAAPLRDQPLVQSTIGHCEADLRSGHALLGEAVNAIWMAATTGTVTLEERVGLRLAATHAIRLAVQVVDAVYNASGVTAVYEDHLLQRYFQDIHVMSQHLQGRLAHYELVGRYALNLPIDEARL